MKILIEAYKPHDSNLVDIVVRKLQINNIGFNIKWLSDIDMINGKIFGIYIDNDGMFERQNSVTDAINNIILNEPKDLILYG